MTLAHADEEWIGPVVDVGDPLPTVSRHMQFAGHVWDIVSDEVDFGDHRVVRDLLLHPGAVAVIALDDDDRVLFIRQYRHAVGGYLFEPPAGLLDAVDEDPAATAARELAEEAGYGARTWHVLLDLYLSPGGSSEAIRVYLARDLSVLPGGRLHTGESEEAHLPRAWVPLDEARDLVLSGTVGSPTSVAGVLAAWASRASGWTSLRPADAPWPAREQLAATGRVRLPQRDAT